MIWAKTDAGRIEIQARALVKERAVRNLLLLIDGQKPEAMLLASLSGIGHDDFLTLQRLGLIAPAPRQAAAEPASAFSPAPSSASAPAPVAAEAGPPLDYAQFTAALTQIISKQLGLRGFMLTLALEKAASPDELQEVARRTLEQLRERKGEAAAAAARRALYGA